MRAHVIFLNNGAKLAREHVVRVRHDTCVRAVQVVSHVVEVTFILSFDSLVAQL